MAIKFEKEKIIVKLNYKGINYNKSFKSKKEMDKWFEEIIKKN